MEYGIIGEKLGHSLSKPIHEDIGGYTYTVNEISRDLLDCFLKKKDFKGINVTIPYKKDVIPYLDYVDDTVKDIGACNVIVHRDGKLCGYNTDYSGMVAMIRHFGISLSKKKVAILGSGGTSNTSFAVARDLGATSIQRVSREKKEGFITYDDLLTKYSDVEVIINTTPVEMYPNNDKEIISLEPFLKLEAVVDAVYNPLRTNLVLKAKERGLKYTNGLYMLIAQAVYGIKLFKGITLDKSIIDTYFEKMILSRENIVLTGMPTSGKTSVGKYISEVLHMDFVDSDDEIVQQIKMPIRDFFEKYGEAEFRKVEAKIIAEISKKQGVVIATGGGAILRKDNVTALKRNGKIYFLNRSFENLTVTDSRPLSKDKEALRKRYDERYEIYRNTADAIIDGNGNIIEVATRILKGEKI